MLGTLTNSFQFSNQVYKGQWKCVHTPMMECRPAPSSGNVKSRTRRFVPRKVLNRAFLNQKRGSEGHLSERLCLFRNPVKSGICVRKLEGAADRD